MSENLTQSQKEFFNNNGYLVVENVITHKECDKIISTIEQHADKDYAAILNPDRLEFLVSQSIQKITKNSELPDKVEYINKCIATSKFIRSYLKQKSVVKILESLKNKQVVGLMSQMLFKKANSRYAAQGWTPHQDNSYIRNENGAYITTNLFFDDANKENGSMYVYSKSHLNGIFDAEDRVSYRETKGDNPGRTIDDKILNQFDKIDLTFKKGSLLVLHGNCIHGSYPNVSKRDRPLLSCSYIVKDEYFYPGYNAQRKVIPLN